MSFFANDSRISQDQEYSAGRPSTTASNHTSFLFSQRYQTRQKMINSMREKRKEKINRDFTESRALNYMQFPNTKHMDLLPSTRRGFDAFINESLKERRLANQERRSDSSKRQSGANLSSRSDQSDSSNNFHLKGRRYSTNIYSTCILSPDVVRVCNTSESQISNKSLEERHLIIQVRVIVTSGDLTPFSQMVGILCITSTANKIDISNALYNQLSLQRKLFTVKIYKRKKSCTPSYEFNSLLESLNKSDLEPLNWCLCSDTQIEVRIVDKEDTSSNKICFSSKSAGEDKSISIISDSESILSQEQESF